MYDVQFVKYWWWVVCDCSAGFAQGVALR